MKTLRVFFVMLIFPWKQAIIFSLLHAGALFAYGHYSEPCSINTPVYILDFGKYKGKKLNEVPTSYLEWIIKEKIHTTNPSLMTALVLSRQLRLRRHGKSRGCRVRMSRR